MTIVSVDRLRVHVEELGRAFHVRIVFAKIKPEEGFSANIWNNRLKQSVGKCVVVQRVTDETSYAVAMHELGHCLAPLGMLDEAYSEQMRETRQPSTVRDLKLQLTSETAAWEWAEHYALDWTVAMEQVKNISLQSYQDRVRRITGKVV